MKTAIQLNTAINTALLNIDSNLIICNETIVMIKEENDKKYQWDAIKNLWIEVTNV